MTRSHLCDYSDAYIYIYIYIYICHKHYNSSKHDSSCCTCKYTNKKVIFENCAPFTNCESKINNTQIDMFKILI